MSEWLGLKEKEIAYWIRGQKRGRKMLPIFRLTKPPIETEDRIWASYQTLPVEHRRRADSGVLEVRIPSRLIRSFQEGAGIRVLDATRQAQWIFDSFLAQLAHQEDDRKFERVESFSEVIALSMRTLLPDVEGLPVIGPGGQVTIYRQERIGERNPEKEIEATADLVLRRRVKPGIQTRWRDEDEIMRAVSRKIEQISSGAEVQRTSVQFGYFELSKYDDQSLMRPVIAISLLLSFAAGEGNPTWGELIVESITEDDNIEPTEGLGPWGG